MEGHNPATVGNYLGRYVCLDLVEHVWRYASGDLATNDSCQVADVQEVQCALCWRGIHTGPSLTSCLCCGEPRTSNLFKATLAGTS